VDAALADLVTWRAVAAGWGGISEGKSKAMRIQEQEAVGARTVGARWVVLSGIQPSGKLHLGNYFGAVRQYLRLMEAGHDCYYFLANYHALTTIRSRQELLDLTEHAAIEYLALGLDPERCAIYRQSDLPEVCELQWILSTITPMGLLERCHAYKEKVAEGLPADHGLFAYPVLQAADILIVRANVVPVGKDQKQHIEVTRDIAQRFNRIYGDIFTIPEPYIDEETAVVPGTDGQKMSKSYGNTIDLFAPEEVVRRQIFSIVTDSATVEEPKDPDRSHLYAILKLFCTPAEQRSWADRFRSGGLAYSEVKREIWNRFMEFFGPARRRRAELEQNRDYVEGVLRKGAERARQVALPLMQQVREAVGIPNPRWW
jgi:tryptophanyl-tRNA synthetase